MQTTTTIRFRRTDLSDGAAETLTLVTLPEGLTLYSFALDRVTEYAVVVDYGSDGTGDAALCDLDGEVIPSDVATIRACALATDAPRDVLTALPEGWASGNCVVERLTEVGP